LLSYFEQKYTVMSELFCMISNSHTYIYYWLHSSCWTKSMVSAIGKILEACHQRFCKVLYLWNSPNPEKIVSKIVKQSGNE